MSETNVSATETGVSVADVLRAHFSGRQRGHQTDLQDRLDRAASVLREICLMTKERTVLTTNEIRNIHVHASMGEHDAAYRAHSSPSIPPQATNGRGT